MKQKTRQTPMLLSTLTGCFLIMIPTAVTWYWGNLSIYVYSYIHYHQNAKSNDVQSPWFLSIYIIMWSLAMILSGHLAKCFSKNTLFTLSVISFNGGFVCGYFVLNRPIIWLDTTMAVLSGLGNGWLFSYVMQTVVARTAKRVGLATSAVVVGNSIGAIVINQLVTHYVNPANLKVDTTVGRTEYFSQKEILEKVPSLFLILVGVNMSCQFVGFCLIRQKSSVVTKIQMDESEDENGNAPKPINCNQPLLGNENKSNSKKVYLTNEGDFLVSANILNQKSNSHIYDWELVPVVGDPIENEKRSSKSPVEVLGMSSFYILWFMLASGDGSYVMMCNYYKAFGQVWIKDDHFLTNLATSLSVINIGMRILWGMSADYFDTKTSLVIFSSLLSVLNNFYYFTPIIGRWVFFGWSLAYGGLSCGLYVNFTTIIIRLYGKEYFHTNFGLLFTATIAINLISPPMFRAILKQWGWFALYTSAGSLALMSLLFVVFFLSSEKKNLH